MGIMLLHNEASYYGKCSPEYAMLPLFFLRNMSCSLWIIRIEIHSNSYNLSTYQLS
jgi:hypothetical protein